MGTTANMDTGTRLDDAADRSLQHPKPKFIDQTFARTDKSDESSSNVSVRDWPITTEVPTIDSKSDEAPKERANEQSVTQQDDSAPPASPNQGTNGIHHLDRTAKATIEDAFKDVSSTAEAPTRASVPEVPVSDAMEERVTRQPHGTQPDASSPMTVDMDQDHSTSNDIVLTTSHRLSKDRSLTTEASKPDSPTIEATHRTRHQQTVTTHDDSPKPAYYIEDTSLIDQLLLQTNEIADPASDDAGMDDAFTTDVLTTASQPTETPSASEEAVTEQGYSALPSSGDSETLSMRQPQSDRNTTAETVTDDFLIDEPLDTAASTAVSQTIQKPEASAKEPTITHHEVDAQGDLSDPEKTFSIQGLSSTGETSKNAVDDFAKSQSPTDALTINPQLLMKPGANTNTTKIDGGTDQTATESSLSYFELSDRNQAEFEVPNTFGGIEIPFEKINLDVHPALTLRVQKQVHGRERTLSVEPKKQSRSRHSTPLKFRPVPIYSEKGVISTRRSLNSIRLGSVEDGRSSQPPNTYGEGSSISRDELQDSSPLANEVIIGTNYLRERGLIAGQFDYASATRYPPSPQSMHRHSSLFLHDEMDYAYHRLLCSRCNLPEPYIRRGGPRGKSRSKSGTASPRSFYGDNKLGDEMFEDDRYKGRLLMCAHCSNTIHEGCLSDTTKSKLLKPIPQMAPRDPSIIVSYRVEYTCSDCLRDKRCAVCRQESASVKEASFAAVKASQDAALNVTDNCSQTTAVASNEPLAAEKEQDLGTADDVLWRIDTAEVPPDSMLYRCSRCVQAFHYHHLHQYFHQAESSLLDLTGSELADEKLITSQRSSFARRNWLCAECIAWPGEIDQVLTWIDTPKKVTRDDNPANEVGNASGSGKASKATSDVAKLIASVPTDETVSRYRHDHSEQYAKEPKLTSPDHLRFYLIKFKDLSYRHAIWVPERWLISIASIKVRNFWKVRQNWVGLPLQDVVRPEYCIVDRILAIKEIPHMHVFGRQGPDSKSKSARKRVCMRFSDSEEDELSSADNGSEEADKSAHDEFRVPSKLSEVLCKWEGLGYEQATWEHPFASDDPFYNAFVVAYKRYQQAADVVVPPDLERRIALEQAEVAQGIESYSERELKTQPSFICGGKMMGHQMEGLNWLIYQWEKNHSCILADDMGLGKTIQIIAFCSFLYHAKEIFPFLIIAPHATIPNWLREFHKWAPQLAVAPLFGNADARALQKGHEIFRAASDRFGVAGSLKCHAVITSYQMAVVELAALTKVSFWPIMVIDEGQRLKNDESLLFTKLKEIRAGQKILLTGTPLQNNIRELFNLMHFLDPKAFKDLKELETKYSDLDQDLVQDLHTLLGPYFLRRTKALVLKHLPSKAEIVVPVSMSLLQREIYRNILSRNFNSLAAMQVQGGNKRGGAVHLTNTLMELRKCLNHPYLIDGIEAAESDTVTTHKRLIESCAKLELLDQMLAKLKEDGHRVLIFSTMKLALSVIEDYMIGAGYKYVRLDGDTPSILRQRNIDAFNAPDSDLFVFLLTTRAGGVGVNLATADTIIIYDADFNPHADTQALSRAYRIGQQNSVLVLKFMTRNSIEEKIVQIGKKKMVLDHLIVGKMEDKDLNPDDIESILRFGAKALFEEQAEATTIKYDDSAINRLLDRDQMKKIDEEEAKEANCPVRANEMEKGDKLSFSFARIWTADANGQVQSRNVNHVDKNDEQDDNFWNTTLKQRAEKYNAIIEQGKGRLGRGGRKRRQITYLESGTRDIEDKANGRKRKRKTEEADYLPNVEESETSEGDAKDGQLQLDPEDLEITNAENLDPHANRKTAVNGVPSKLPNLPKMPNTSKSNANGPSSQGNAEFFQKDLQPIFMSMQSIQNSYSQQQQSTAQSTALTIEDGFYPNTNIRVRPDITIGDLSRAHNDFPIHLPNCYIIVGFDMSKPPWSPSWGRLKYFAPFKLEFSGSSWKATLKVFENAIILYPQVAYDDVHNQSIMKQQQAAKVQQQQANLALEFQRRLAGLRNSSTSSPPAPVQLTNASVLQASGVNGMAGRKYPSTVGQQSTSFPTTTRKSVSQQGLQLQQADATVTPLLQPVQNFANQPYQLVKQRNGHSNSDAKKRGRPRKQTSASRPQVSAAAVPLAMNNLLQERANLSKVNSVPMHTSQLKTSQHTNNQALQTAAKAAPSRGLQLPRNITPAPAAVTQEGPNATSKSANAASIADANALSRTPSTVIVLSDTEDIDVDAIDPVASPAKTIAAAEPSMQPQDISAPKGISMDTDNIVSPLSGSEKVWSQVQVSTELPQPSQSEPTSTVHEVRQLLTPKTTPRQPTEQPAPQPTASKDGSPVTESADEEEECILCLQVHADPSKPCPNQFNINLILQRIEQVRRGGLAIDEEERPGVLALLADLKNGVKQYNRMRATRQSRIWPSPIA